MVRFNPGKRHKLFTKNTQRIMDTKIAKKEWLENMSEFYDKLSEDQRRYLDRIASCVYNANFLKISPCQNDTCFSPTIEDKIDDIKFYSEELIKTL